MISTMCSADSNSMSKTKTGSEPAVSATPAASMASGMVTLNRASLPAISAQPSSNSMMTTSASIDPPAAHPSSTGSLARAAGRRDQPESATPRYWCPAPGQ